MAGETPQPDARDDEAEELVLKIADDAAGDDPPKLPPVPGPGPAVVPSAPSVPPAPQAALADLERREEQRRQENERLEAANRRLQQERDNALALAQEAERRGVSAQEVALEANVNAATEHMKALDEQAVTAMEAGEFRKAQEINRKVAEIQSNVTFWKVSYQKIKAEREQGRLPGQRPPSAPAAPAAADAKRAALEALSPESRAFIEKNPSLMRSDGTIKNSVFSAHYKALDANIAADTPQYFEFVEKELGLGPVAAARPNGGEQSYAAPVERGPGPGSGTSVPGLGADGSFKMTTRMKQLAHDAGVTNEDWAKNYVRLVKEGRIQPLV